jgi:hypothetical protein
MAANPTMANLNLIPNGQQIVSETSEPKPTSLLQRIEVVLGKAFGDDEQTIANSLRGL